MKISDFAILADQAQQACDENQLWKLNSINEQLAPLNLVVTASKKSPAKWVAMLHIRDAWLAAGNTIPVYGQQPGGAG